MGILAAVVSAEIARTVNAAPSASQEHATKSSARARSSIR
jgi:hypothetical protein